MMCLVKNLKKTGNLFGVWSNFGFKLIIVSLLVLSLGALQLVAIPSKANAFQAPIPQISQSNSQTQSLESSETPSVKQGFFSRSQTATLQEVDSSLESASNKLLIAQEKLDTQIELTTILQDSSQIVLDVNKGLNLTIDGLNEEVAIRDGQIKELRRNKVIKVFDVGATYNLVAGWGVGASIGLKYGHITTKFGAQALVADLMNPVKLPDLNTYTFTGTLGFEW